MSTKETKYTGKPHANSEQKEIDAWGEKARKKIRLIQKSRNQNMVKKMNSSNNEEDLQSYMSNSINRLREKAKSERSQSSIISNRMNFLQTDLKRKKQILDIAKSKYQKIIEVRHKSFIEKTELNKERQNYLKKKQQIASFKASRIKSQRENCIKSAQLWKSQKQVEAMEIKKMKFSNEKLLSERQKLDLYKKKQLVEKLMQSTNISRQKNEERKKNIVEYGKKMHERKLYYEFQKGEMQRRKNTSLIKDFKRHVKNIEEQNRKYALQLQEYQKLLGLNNRGQFERRGSTESQFYITNY